MMQPVRVTSEADFVCLLNHLSNEVFRASDYWHLQRGLDSAIDDYGDEFAQSQAFWGFTFNALSEVTLFYLVRLYDQTAGALSLGNFLMTVRACSAYFSKDAFRLRMQGNPNVEALATDVRTLDLPVLEQELLSVSEADPLVSRLWELRNRYLAHKEARLVRLANLASLAGLTADDVETLLQRAKKIINSYSVLYRASWYDKDVVGSDDYLHMLGLLRFARESIAAKHEEEYKQAKTRAQAVTSSD